MNHWEYIPNEGETVVAKGHPQLNDPFLRRYHLRKAFLTAAQVYLGLWGARLLAENILGRRWAGVGVWVQAGAALVYLHLRLQTEFYGASRQGEQMVRSFGDSYRRQHYRDSQYWH